MVDRYRTLSIDANAPQCLYAGVVPSGSTTITAGNVYVDVAHGLETIPDISKIHITEQDNLGGRSKWVSNVGASTFRINISSKEVEENHIFSWMIV